MPTTPGCAPLVVQLCVVCLGLSSLRCTNPQDSEQIVPDCLKERGEGHDSSSHAAALWGLFPRRRRRWRCLGGSRSTRSGVACRADWCRFGQAAARGAPQGCQAAHQQCPRAWQGHGAALWGLFPRRRRRWRCLGGSRSTRSGVAFHQALGHLCLRTIVDHPTSPVMTRPRSACCHSSNWLRRNSYTSSITPSSSASRSSMCRSQSTCLRQATRRQRGRRSAEMLTAQRNKRKGTTRQVPWAFPTLVFLSSS